MAGNRASEHFPRCLGVIPDGPSHRFADPGRHRPAMTIAMLTIGSSAAGRQVSMQVSSVTGGLGRVTWQVGGLGSVTCPVIYGLSTVIYGYLSENSIFGKSSNRTHFASRGLGWTPIDIRHLPGTWTTSLEPFMTPFSQVLDLILESLY